MQDVCLARYCILRGSRIARWDDLVSLIKALKDHTLLSMIQPPHNMYASGAALAVERQDAIRHSLLQGNFPTLDQLMQYARTRETSNPLDKIYAILRLVDPELVKQIKIDYSDESRENYWRAYIELGHLFLAEKS